MIPAELASLARPRAERAAPAERSGAAEGGADALFEKALRGLEGRLAPKGEAEGDARRAPREPAAEPVAEEAGEAAAPKAEPAPRLGAFALDLSRSTPIRAGALAFQAARAVERAAEEAPPAVEPQPAARVEDLLAALAERRGAPAAAEAIEPPDASPQPPPARAAAAARADALFPDDPDLRLATPPEPVVGQALKATVLSQATHLPPALGAANLQAVVDAATALLAEGDAPTGRAALAFDPGLAPSSPLAKGAAAPVKVLTVQLQPVSLGVVTVALRMTADGVALEIAAADERAAAMLRQDEARIVEAVRRSGLAGEVVSITTVDPGAPARAADAGPQGRAADEAARERAFGGEGERRGGQPFERRGDHHAEDDARGDPRRRDGADGLYL